ncbi:hypothetical protein SAMN05216411_102291 [Nitrosospira multiformis]|nr:hypothetical protein SAMN05216411_102291 [Nitrosospira multiformis]
MSPDESLILPLKQDREIFPAVLYVEAHLGFGGIPFSKPALNLSKDLSAGGSFNLQQVISGTALPLVERESVQGKEDERFRLFEGPG